MSRKKGVVYEIPCEDCALTYVGETMRTLNDRIKEHRWHLEKGDILKSAVAEHFGINDHNIQFNETKVIDFAPRTISCHVIEALHISLRRDLTMNKFKISQQWISCVL